MQLPAIGLACVRNLEYDKKVKKCLQVEFEGNFLFLDLQENVPGGNVVTSPGY